MGVPYQARYLVRTGAERATLVRRTYALVFASILVTIGGVAFGLTQPALMGAVVRHPWIMLLVMFAPLMMAMSVRDRFPQNIGLVFLFTFVEGIWLSPWISVLPSATVAQAGVLTASAFGVLTGYAWLSRRDFSAWGSFLTVGLWVLFFTLLLNMFFHSAAAGLWLAAVGVLIFSGLLVFDTWRLRNVFGPEDYVLAAVNIYLDLLNMFVFILSILGAGDRRR